MSRKTLVKVLELDTKTKYILWNVLSPIGQDAILTSAKPIHPLGGHGFYLGLFQSVIDDPRY